MIWLHPSMLPRQIIYQLSRTQDMHSGLHPVSATSRRSRGRTLSFSHRDTNSHTTIQYLLPEIRIRNKTNKGLEDRAHSSNTETSPQQAQRNKSEKAQDLDSGRAARQSGRGRTAQSGRGRTAQSGRGRTAQKRGEYSEVLTW